MKLKSYSPYSGIEEACFVAGESGLFYPGVRVENISFPLTISGIHAAICSCLANGDQPKEIYPLHGGEKPDLIDFWVDEFGLKRKERTPEKFNLYDPVLYTEAPSDIAEVLGELCNKAVVQHSGFPVAALLQSGNKFISGVNVEVSSWSMGLCAERVALCRALAHGITEFEKMFIYAPKSNFCSPCGACRQVLYEFMSDKIVVLYHRDQEVTRHFVQHLLPHAIISDSLKSKK